MKVYYKIKTKCYILKNVKKIEKSTLLKNAYDFKLEDDSFLIISNCKILKVEQ